MQAINKNLKLQLNNFFTSLLHITIILILGYAFIGIITVANTNFIHFDVLKHVEPSYLITGAILFILFFPSSASSLAIYANCFSNLLTNFKFSLRMGSSRKSFIISNVIFFTVLIVIISILQTVLVYYTAHFTQNVAEHFFTIQETLDANNAVFLKSLFVNILSVNLILAALSEFIAIIFLYIGWKVFFIYVIHFLAYATVNAYSALIDSVTSSLTMPIIILIFAIVKLITSIGIYIYNDK